MQPVPAVQDPICDVVRVPEVSGPLETAVLPMQCADAPNAAPEVRDTSGGTNSSALGLGEWLGVAQEGHYVPVGRNKRLKRWSAEANELGKAGDVRAAYAHVCVVRSDESALFLSPGDTLVLDSCSDGQARVYLAAIVRAGVPAELLVCNAAGAECTLVAAERVVAARQLSESIPHAEAATHLRKWLATREGIGHKRTSSGRGPCGLRWRVFSLCSSGPGLHCRATGSTRSRATRNGLL